MNPFQRMIFTCLLLLGGLNLSAQLGSTACNYELIYDFSFDSQANYDANWSASSGAWRWIDNGSAATLPGTFWGDRTPIVSPSGGGAAVIGGGASGSLVLGEIDFIDNETVYLRFNQYFRQYQTTLVEVTAQNTATGEEMSFVLNQNVPPNSETSYRDQQVLDLSFLGGAIANITFSYEGAGYFWIIDDVEFYDAEPCPETRPDHYGPILTELNYPYEVDEAGWPYVRNEMVIQFTDDADNAYKQALRDTLGAILVETCVCDSLELWRLGDDIFFDPSGNQSANGGSIGILERVMGANAKTKVQGADPNYYTAAQLQALGNTAPVPLTPSDISAINNIPAAATDVRIAVIDTGVDFLHEDIRPYIRAKAGNCYGDEDILGRNFVQDHNNPQDDHSHGTHVAGIIAQQLTAAAAEEAPPCGFHIIPYKTHDAQGVSNLFDVTCATYQALEDDVSLINDSWGFYGTGSVILQNAIAAAERQEVLILSASGNDSLSLDTLLLFPACYNAPNRITVSSFEANGEGTPSGHSVFANQSTTWVDVAAPGREIFSAIPSWYTSFRCEDEVQNALRRDCKTGTSMATPLVTALAAIGYCESGRDYLTVKNRTLNCANTYPELNGFVKSDLGLTTDVNVLCWTGVAEVEIAVEQAFKVFPNPVQGQLFIEALTDLPAGQIRVFSADGRLLLTRSVDAWLPNQQMIIETGDWPKGLYLLQVQTRAGEWTRKFVR